MTASDDDRIAYLADGPGGSLSEQERAQLDEVRSALRDWETWVEPDAGLEDRIVSAIANEAGTNRAITHPASANRAITEEVGADSATADEAHAKRAPRRPQRFSLGSLFRRPAFAFGGIASALAAAVIIVVVASGGGNAPKPLHFAMIVSGTPLAPKAKGSASLTKTGSGWRIELSASGLPHIENGLYYQAWLKNSTGILVPVGTFNDPAHVTLWSGVPVTKFRTLTVTVQLANGNPASSGKRVLVGRIVPNG